MTEQQVMKPGEAEVTAPPDPVPEPIRKGAAGENTVISPRLKADNVVGTEKTSNHAPKTGGSLDRDVALAELEEVKTSSFIKAWEENEKQKAENKSQKKLSAITAWENSQKADTEAKLKKMEEHLENKKAEYAEKMKNKVALIHKQAEEKRTCVIASREEELLNVNELSYKYLATGRAPAKKFGCF